MSQRGRPRADVVLARSAQISVTARAVVRQFARELGPQRTADACLLISELVANAYRHGGGEIRLSITLHRTHARSPSATTVTVTGCHG